MMKLAWGANVSPLFRAKVIAISVGLDLNRDGKITKAEIVARVQRELDRGLLQQNVFED